MQLLNNENMAYTIFYKCNSCGAEISLSGRMARENMMVQQDGIAMRDMLCLDCYKKSGIEGDNPKVCSYCNSKNVFFNEEEIPCKCGGKLMNNGTVMI